MERFCSNAKWNSNESLFSTLLINFNVMHNNPRKQLSEYVMEIKYVSSKRGIFIYIHIYISNVIKIITVENIEFYGSYQIL